MIDYLELLLDAQEQEEPEEETPEFEPLFFSAVPNRARARKKTDAQVQAEKGSEIETETVTETDEQDIRSGLPKTETGTGGGSAAGSRIKQAGQSQTRSAETGTADTETDAVKMLETDGIESIRSRTAADGTESTRARAAADGTESIRTRAAADGAFEPGGARTYGGWAAVVGKIEPETDMPETGMPAAAGTGSVPLGAAQAQAAGAGIAGVLAAARRDILSGGTGGAETTGAAFLYQQMAQTGQAVGSLRQNAHVLTVTESSSAIPGPGAAELDEIFSRDARRYDGGFSLF